MNSIARLRAGYTLIELFTVIAVLSIFAAVALPMMNPAVNERLDSVAQLVADDLANARTLAVVNNSLYRITFDKTNNLYYLEHSGANTALNTLPANSARLASDSATRQTTRIDDLPSSRGTVKLHAIVSATLAPLTQLEFRNYGETTQTSATTIWLTAGAADVKRYVPISVNPVTGLATVGSITSIAPSISSGS